eukprot:CAMPEP_0201989362 /NCGR_PEP_ID=MMETSP0904-20121228/92819_1 /ASSEMBLY_ACC=CAM_ASM_000553 /TAXON_ID=420261 /ORGANISM="Thalassiosira antarctica, Strain CCMP982" /LENGTH=53 /DNA_ID=CAMNT_0048543585 /DNA_START=556 /DNA_END=717 /DNA_ORIENTATION=+
MEECMADVVEQEQEERAVFDSTTTVGLDTRVALRYGNYTCVCKVNDNQCLKHG